MLAPSCEMMMFSRSQRLNQATSQQVSMSPMWMLLSAVLGYCVVAVKGQSLRPSQQLVAH